MQRAPGPQGLGEQGDWATSAGTAHTASQPTYTYKCSDGAVSGSAPDRASCNTVQLCPAVVNRSDWTVQCTVAELGATSYWLEKPVNSFSADKNIYKLKYSNQMHASLVFPLPRICPEWLVEHWTERGTESQLVRLALSRTARFLDSSPVLAFLHNAFQTSHILKL